MHGEGQPLSLDIVVSVNSKEEFGGDALAELIIDMRIFILCLAFFT